MKRLKIVADNTVPYLRGIAEPVADVVYLHSADFTPEAVKDADALIVRSIDKCTRSLLAGSRVQLIATATIGFDHIDTHYCDQAAIAWRNAPGCNASSVAQYVMASLLTVSLRTQEPLEGKTIGIVGMGHVGREVERLCTALGMRILRNDPPRAALEGEAGFVSLSTIASEADIVSLHVPYTREGEHATHHLANAPFFAELQRRPWFLNTCRGPVHDTEALIHAHRSGRVGQLIIDCWENEPNIDHRLLNLAAIATPHIAGFSADGKANGTRQCLENVSSFFGVTFRKLGKVLPPPPANPLIDLARLDSHRTERALLYTFCPLAVDRALRLSPERFEGFRAHYDHPREYPAYTILNPTPNEAALFHRLGFNIG